MLSVPDALAQIDQAVALLDTEVVSILDAVGCRLVADIISEVDSPPFDKSMMDGFALHSSDAGPGAVLKVIATLYAGNALTSEIGRGESVRIMTGAPIPRGADCVLRSESAEFDESTNDLRFKAQPSPGENIILRGSSMRAGETVLQQGQRLSPSAVGLLAELGHPTVAVSRRPQVAILATGDELVSIDAIPGPGQIRNSNESMLCASVMNCGGLARPSGVCRDVADDLDRAIAEGLRSDILCLSGGVSAGEKDLVPAALARAGVRQVFHQIKLKPGKPLWFGRFAGVDGHTCLVFGLPGNPVSSLVCFELFVRHAMERMQGAPADWRVSWPVGLTSDIVLKSDRPVFHPAKLICGTHHSNHGGIRQVEILSWQGSSDLRGTVAADGVVHFPAGEHSWPRGSMVEFLPFGGSC